MKVRHLQGLTLNIPFVSIHAPVKVRLMEVNNMYLDLKVSIHAPMKVRPDEGLVSLTEDVSIHAPMKVRPAYLLAVT